ncbi:Cell division protein ZapD [hydrothermal vent metagenome]|uniref:Cell division protein ZapD n=1 Tax=hydrothermal vent metagenome TaxID=652676 RepID=A0A3B0Y1L8_9ZZZZ
MTDQLIFEQPLNERIRTFLRLEHLFKQFKQHLEHDSAWDTQSAVKSVLDLMSLIGRGDIKRETIKELERQNASLQSFIEIPGINHDRLTRLINEQKNCLQSLHNMGGNIGHELLQNELLNAIRQRLNMPGGLCEFDLPVYSHWLSQPYETRKETLQNWFAPFVNLDSAVDLILQVIRDSSDATDETAEGSFYQRNLDANQTCLMIRVFLPPDVNVFPEVSAGKHRFSIRFLQAADLAQRPEQSKVDCNFKLACCIL